jgi:hypothetical protein
MRSKLRFSEPVIIRGIAPKEVRWVHTPFVTKLALGSAFILAVAIVTLPSGDWKPTVAAAFGFVTGWVFCHD